MNLAAQIQPHRPESKCGAALHECLLKSDDRQWMRAMRAPATLQTPYRPRRRCCSRANRRPHKLASYFLRHGHGPSQAEVRKKDLPRPGLTAWRAILTQGNLPGPPKGVSFL